MDTATHIARIDAEARRFAAAAEQAGLDAPVPSCPDWDVRDLLRHLSLIHLWAAAHVVCRATTLGVDDLTELSSAWPDLAEFWPDDEQLAAYYLATNANLVRELSTAQPDIAALTFLPAPSPLAMWARRQCHELTIHRIDAEQAADDVTPIDAAVAADGIDELLAAFAPRETEFPLDEARTMLVETSDTHDHWRLTLGPDGITTTRSDEPADVRLRGRATDLYLAVWNRGDDASLDVTGDRDVLAAWHAHYAIRWSGAVDHRDQIGGP